MTRITDEELALGDATLVIPEGRYWRMPKAIYEEMRLFGGRFVNGNVVVTVPVYRLRMWVEMAKSLTDKQAK